MWLGFYAAELNGLSGDTIVVLCGDVNHNLLWCVEERKDLRKEVQCWVKEDKREKIERENMKEAKGNKQGCEKHRHSLRVPSLVHTRTECGLTRVRPWSVGTSRIMCTSRIKGTSRIKCGHILQFSTGRYLQYCSSSWIWLMTCRLFPQ